MNIKDDQEQEQIEWQLKQISYTHKSNNQSQIPNIKRGEKRKRQDNEQLQK